MPRSFLITKLQKWKGCDVREDDEVASSSDDVVDVSDAPVDDQTTQVESLSRDYRQDITVRMNAVKSDKSDDSSLACLVGMLSKVV